jgi:F0F1-type ATP synthase assembly protein I
MAEERKQPGLAAAYRKAGPYLNLGIEFAAAILLCLFGGRWLDGKLGTAPYLMLVGTFLGITVGFLNLYRTAIRLQERDKKDKH